jgi:toxin YoeB
MKYKVTLEKQAIKDIQKITKAGNKKDITKLYQLFEELKIHPETDAGNPEQLKYSLSGYWSRCINKKDRLIYEIIEEPDCMVVVVSVLGHYE